jgi:hypothetical protein
MIPYLCLIFLHLFFDALGQPLLGGPALDRNARACADPNLAFLVRVTPDVGPGTGCRDRRSPQVLQGLRVPSRHLPEQVVEAREREEFFLVAVFNQHGPFRAYKKMSQFLGRGNTLEVLRLRYGGLAGVSRDLFDVLLLQLHGEQDFDRGAHIVHEDLQVLLG